MVRMISSVRASPKPGDCASYQVAALAISSTAKGRKITRRIIAAAIGRRCVRGVAREEFPHLGPGENLPSSHRAGLPPHASIRHHQLQSRNAPIPGAVQMRGLELPREFRRNSYGEDTRRPIEFQFGYWSRLIACAGNWL